MSRGCLDHVFEIAEQGVTDKGCHSDFQFQGGETIRLVSSSPQSYHFSQKITFHFSSLFLTFPLFPFPFHFQMYLLNKKGKKEKEMEKQKEERERKMENRLFADSLRTRNF